MYVDIKKNVFFIRILKDSIFRAIIHKDHTVGVKAIEHLLGMQSARNALGNIFEIFYECFKYISVEESFFLS